MHIPAPGGAPGRLRLLTANVLFRNPDAGPFLEVLRCEEPDLVALQEVSLPFARTLEAGLGCRYPHRAVVPADGSTGMALLSRFPFSGPVETRGRAEVLDLQQATICVGDTAVTVLNVHPYPPVTRWFGTGPIPSPRGYQRQRRILHRIRRRALAADTPVLLAGDFNMTRRQSLYHILAGPLRDAHAAAGTGGGKTYPVTADSFRIGPVRATLLRTRPFMRIDYIFYSDHWHADRCWTGVYEGSDHCYVAADLTLGEG